MTDITRQEPSDRSDEGRATPADEAQARRLWQQPAPAEASLRRTQVARLIRRRPLLKGLAAGAGLLIASGGDLKAALLAAGTAYAVSTESTEEATTPAPPSETTPPPATTPAATTPPPATTPAATTPAATTPAATTPAATTSAPTTPAPSTTTLPPVTTTVARTQREDKDSKKSDQNQKDFTNTSGDDDHRTEGNVIEVNLNGSPPTITIGTKDGPVILELRGDAKTVTVKVGDYVSGRGDKIDEGHYTIDSIKIG